MHKEYAQTADQVLSDLQSGPEGLSAAQAVWRNTAPTACGRPPRPPCSSGFCSSCGTPCC